MRLIPMVRLPRIPDISFLSKRSQFPRACGGRPEGNIHIVGFIHPYHAPHNCPVHELYASAKENTGCSRNGHIDFRR